FNFFSAAVDSTAMASCPRCGREKLPKRPSTFATLKHQGEDEPSPFEGLDDGRMEGAMDALMREMGDLDEDADPAQVGKFFRRFGDLSGLEMGPRMEEALSRMEAGEDLDQIESEFDDLGDDESLDELFKLKEMAQGRRQLRPEVDPELYFL
ncbi:MAG: zinc ribbon domain-containing protein, partial [Acidobacteriota bacterium]|nr:zinc ribbon domain-containing protein [Acidobacteriota bacterium]